MNKITPSSICDSELHSVRYQDYVIRDGKLVGQFEDMYRNSAEVPWHQDETANAIFSDLTVAILKHKKVTSLLDVGCGLGYMAERLRQEMPELRRKGRVVGIDVSETATAKVAALFPKIEFRAGRIESAISTDETFDVVVIKDVLWYSLLFNRTRYVSQRPRVCSNINRG